MSDPEIIRECPDCHAHGWIMMPKSNGEPEQFQCQRCAGNGYLAAVPSGDAEGEG